MTDQTLIQKFLPQEVWELCSTYTIPSEFIEDTPDLIVLILQSRSIDTTEEKQNWFNLLPMMNTEQVEKLRAILIKEKTKLAEIEAKYEEKKQEIKQKYLTKRQEMGYVKKVSDIRQNESVAQAQEEQEADALLNAI
ncbi:MAG: hypothetical protein RL023_819 [Candidatus Parcubacteria bacterium]|jgi:hypothetical protein